MKVKKSLYLLPIIFFFVLLAGRAQAATLNLTAEKDTYKVGDSFDVNVKIDSEEAGINGAQATIRFDSTLIEATAVDKTDSIFDFWLTNPTIATGQVTFIAAATDGFTGKSLQALKISFKAKGAGTVSFVLGDAAITIADGSGSNVLSKSNNLSVNLVSGVGKTIPTPLSKPTQITRPPTLATGLPKQPIVAVSLYPDPAKWYNTSANFFASWQLPKDISDVAAVLDKSQGTVPAKSEGLFELKQFSALADGIYYLHARFKNNVGWGPVRHYKIAIDTTPPSTFSITFPNGEPGDNPIPVVSYQSGDSLSGLAHYDIGIDNNSSASVTASSFTLPPQLPGKHNLKISAYDNAGNAASQTVHFEIISIEPPTITFVSKNVFTGEGSLFSSGAANPTYKVKIALKDQFGNSVYTDTKTPDEKGTWNVNIDTPLKKQLYHLEAATEDNRGAVSNRVTSGQIAVRDRPLFTVGRIEITLTEFFALFILIVLGAFGLGRASLRFAENERNLDSTMAERDIENVFNLFEKDVSAILSKYTDKGLEPTAAVETKLLLEKLLSKLATMKDYVKQDVGDITNARHFFHALARKIKNKLHIN